MTRRCTTLDYTPLGLPRPTKNNSHWSPEKPQSRQGKTFDDGTERSEDTRTKRSFPRTQRVHREGPPREHRRLILVCACGCEEEPSPPVWRRDTCSAIIERTPRGCSARADAERGAPAPSRRTKPRRMGKKLHGFRNAPCAFCLARARPRFEMDGGSLRRSGVRETRKVALGARPGALRRRRRQPGILIREMGSDKADPFASGGTRASSFSAPMPAARGEHD